MVYGLPHLTSKIFCKTNLYLASVPLNSLFVGCPRSYKPAPNEDVPGDVTDLTVTFVHEKKGATKAWVANVSWTAPKGNEHRWYKRTAIKWVYCETIVFYAGMKCAVFK